jgi:uncharacterized damage-inducible protein DinB
MGYAETLLQEFDAEMASTRKVLERIPEDKFAWKAHPKSRTIGWNANHLVEIPGWMPGILGSDSWDINPPGGPAYESPTHTDRQALLAAFDRNVADARAAIAGLDESKLGDPWQLLSGGQVFLSMPRAAVIRSFVLNHLIHHRAIACVYLRLNDVPVPGMYGPSGDE